MALLAKKVLDPCPTVTLNFNSNSCLVFKTFSQSTSKVLSKKWLLKTYILIF